MSGQAGKSLDTIAGHLEAGGLDAFAVGRLLIDAQRVIGRAGPMSLRSLVADSKDRVFIAGDGPLPGRPPTLTPSPPPQAYRTGLQIGERPDAHFPTPPEDDPRSEQGMAAVIRWRTLAEEVATGPHAEELRRSWPELRWPGRDAPSIGGMTPAALRDFAAAHADLCRLVARHLIDTPERAAPLWKKYPEGITRSQLCGELGIKDDEFKETIRNPGGKKGDVHAWQKVQADAQARVMGYSSNKLKCAALSTWQPVFTPRQVEDIDRLISEG